MGRLNSNSLIIARQRDEKSAHFLSTEEYIERRISYAEMIDRGEPFSFRDKTPLIYVFGPKTFWKLENESFLVYGAALDPEDYDEVEDVLDFRRQGNVYGRWYSVYVPEGDLGYQSYLSVKEVSYQEYVSFIDRLENHKL